VKVGTESKYTDCGGTILYINKYYEKNLTTSKVTTYYYLGDRIVAMRKGSSLRYIHQGHLTGTAVISGGTNGAPRGIRTHDPRFRRPMLCPLSYRRKSKNEAKIAPSG
jgi:hypothetical protein